MTDFVFSLLIPPRVLQLMNLTDARLQVSGGCEKLEIAMLSFFEQFRKIYVGDQVPYRIALLSNNIASYLCILKNWFEFRMSFLIVSSLTSIYFMSLSSINRNILDKCFCRYRWRLKCIVACLKCLVCAMNRWYWAYSCARLSPIWNTGVIANLSWSKHYFCWMSCVLATAACAN